MLLNKHLIAPLRSNLFNKNMDVKFGMVHVCQILRPLHFRSFNDPTPWWLVRTSTLHPTKWKWSSPLLEP